MPAIEFYYPLYPNNLPPTEENPDGVDPRNWITIGGGGGTQYFELSGAVTGSLLNGIVATTLSAAQNLPSRFLHLNYEDTGAYGDPYFLSNFLPITDPEPSLSFVTQTGSFSSQTLRRWDMNFKTGLANSVTNEFELSMYHNLLPGNTITPLKISYSIADARPTISLVGLLDLGNYNARSTASPISNYHLANKGYVDYTVATYPLNLLVPTGDVDLGVYRIASSSTPVSSNHLTNKSYVDTKPLNSFPVTGTIDTGANAIKSSYTPVANADLVNKLYVDNLVSSNVTLKSVGFNRGDIVQLDNLRIRMAPTGEYNVEVATVSGTMAITYTRDLFYAQSTFAVNSTYFTVTTTFSKPIVGNNLNIDGSYYRIHITDTTNNRFYRCTMYNASLTNSKIPIILERLI